MKQGIESQFWNLKEPDIKDPVKDLGLQIEIVKEFPKKLLDNSREIICWAFEANSKNLYGFPKTGGGIIKTNIIKLYVIVNDYRVPQEFIAYNYGYTLYFKLEESATHYEVMLNILKDENNLWYSQEDIITIIFEKYIYDESQTSYDRDPGPVKHISIEEYKKEKEKNEPNH